MLGYKQQHFLVLVISMSPAHFRGCPHSSVRGLGEQQSPVPLHDFVDLYCVLPRLSPFQNKEPLPFLVSPGMASPLIVLVVLLCTFAKSTTSFLRCGDETCTRASRCGRTVDLYNGTMMLSVVFAVLLWKRGTAAPRSGAQADRRQRAGNSWVLTLALPPTSLVGLGQAT